jgi:hypothetical protein
LERLAAGVGGTAERLRGGAFEARDQHYLRSIGIIVIGPVMISELRPGPTNDPLNFPYSAGDQWRDFLTIITVPQISQFVQERIERVNYRITDRQSFVLHFFD